VVPELQKRGIFRRVYEGGRCGRIWGCRGRKIASLRVNARIPQKWDTGFATRIRAKQGFYRQNGCILALKTLTLGDLRLGCRQMRAASGRRPDSRYFEV